LDDIQTKVFRVFLLAIHSHLYSFALKFLFLQTHANSYSFYCSVTVQWYTVKEKGRKPDKKPYPLPYGLRNPYRNLKSESSQDYAQKPQRVHEFGFQIQCEDPQTVIISVQAKPEYPPPPSVSKLRGLSKSH
jgi:hypothetical protein